MSRSHASRELDSAAGNRSTESPDMSEEARQIPSTNLLQISEGEGSSSSKSPGEEADKMHRKETERNGETPSISVIEEYIRKEEQDTARPSLRSNVSSFAAPTKASEAKKNEKIELAQFVKKTSLSKEPPGWPGFAMQSPSASMPVSRRSSLKRRSVTRSTSPKNYDVAADNLPQTEKHRGTRSRSLGSVVSDALAEEEVIVEVLGGAPVMEEEALEYLFQEKQMKEEEEEVQGVEEPRIQDEDELEEVQEISIKEEPLEHHVEEPEPEPEGSQEQASLITPNSTALPLQEGHSKDIEAQIVIPQGQFESISQHSTKEDEKENITIADATKNAKFLKIVAEKEDLQAEREKAETQHDEVIRQHETVQQDLQTVKDDTVKLKRENDKLVIQLRESTDLIAARNAREPNLPALEVVEAENQRLRVAVDKKEKERSDANAFCEVLDDQLSDTQKKLEHQVTSITELCKIVDLMSRSLSNGDNVDVPHPAELNESLAQASEIQRLQIKITQLIGTFSGELKMLQDENGRMKLQAAKQEFEIITLEKLRAYQQEEMLSPGLQSPLLSSAMHLNRDDFKECYERERQKRKEIERELIKAGKCLSLLQPEKERLESDFTKAQEELANLRPKADKLEKDAKGWKEDSEEKKSQLEERSRAFETSTNKQRQETLRYIKDYYRKTKDEAHWEVQGLQKKLASLEEEHASVKRDFEQAKVENARLADGVTRLRKKNKKRNADIDKIQEVFMYGGDFPNLSDGDDSSSSTSASTISSPAHSPHRARRPPPIPRCHLPAAIDARKAKISAYKQELKVVREQALFNVSVKPSMSFKTRIGVGRNDIMEKVREWKMGDSYPPRKPGWGELRRKSVWERWDGEDWAREFAQGNDVDILKKSGLWNEAWV